MFSAALQPRGVTFDFSLQFKYIQFTMFSMAYVYVLQFVRPLHLWGIWRTTAYCPCLRGNPYSTELEGKTVYDFSTGWGSDSSSGHRWGKRFLTHFMDLVWLWKERFKDRLEGEIAEQKKWDCSVQKSTIRWELPPGDLRNRGWGPESRRREELGDRCVVCGYDRSEGESDTGQTGAIEPAYLWWGREGPWRLAASLLNT